MTKKALEGTNKERILEAAAAEFAERGFDGARVDEIAKRAGVNKALIYYYYKSKEELLALLFSEVRDAVFALMNSSAVRAVDFSSIEAVRAMLCAFLDLLEERQNVVRVLVMETAKRSPINTVIFSMLGEVIDRMFAMAVQERIPLNPDRSAAMVTEFFTGIMPLLDYVVYHEIWMDRFDIDEATLRRHFVDSFLGTHFAFTVGTHLHPSSGS